MQSRSAILASAILAASATFASAATTYTFTNISGNNATNAAAGESQLRMSVEDSGGDALFKFFHSGTTAMSMTQIYWDVSTSLLTGVNTITNQAGVDFSNGGSPPNLPAGNTVSFTADYRVTADAPVQPNGVNPGEQLSVLMNIGGAFGIGDIIAALNNGSLRVGIHVQGFDNGGSESFVTDGPEDPDNGDTPVVPVPASAWMGLAMLGGLGGIKALRRKQTEI